VRTPNYGKLKPSTMKSYNFQSWKIETSYLENFETSLLVELKLLAFQPWQIETQYWKVDFGKLNFQPWKFGSFQTYSLEKLKPHAANIEIFNFENLEQPNYESWNLQLLKIDISNLSNFKTLELATLKIELSNFATPLLEQKRHERP
jgi:hypothetical protein